MTDSTIYHGIGNSLSVRAGLIYELTKRLAVQDQQDTILKERLVAIAPVVLRKWLGADMVIANLFHYGSHDTKIRFKDNYGFRDFTDVQNKMKLLRKSWKDIVMIKVGVPEPDRVQVWISAIM